MVERMMKTFGQNECAKAEYESYCPHQAQRSGESLQA